jgi:hypothetical protein
MIAEPWPAPARPRALPICGVIAAHILVFMLLVWRLGTAPGLAEPESMSVVLMTLPHRSLQTPDRQSSEVGRTWAAPRPKDHAPDAERLRNAPVQEAPAGIEQVAPEPSGRGDELRSTLRGLLGCQNAALVGLTAEERERCKERQSADAMRAQNAPPPKFNFDRRGAFTSNPVPYLLRRPKNGCKPRAAGDVGPSGQQDAEAGVDCSLAF